MIKWRIPITAILLLLTSSSIADPSWLFSSSYSKKKKEESQQLLHLTSHITGLKGDALKNAEKRLKLNQTIPDKQLTTHQVRRYARQGNKEIAIAIAPYGYFNPTIKHSLQHTGNNWVVTYTVTPGKPLRVTQLQITLEGEAKNNPQLTKLLATVPLKQNAIFTTERYEQTTDQLLIRARELGYIDAKLSKNRIIIDRKAYTCIIEITLDSGGRYYFGGATFSSSPLSPKLLKRYLNFKPGEIYSEQRLIDLQHQLSSSGYFRSVTVTPQINKSKNQRIPVYIDLKKNHRKAYEFGGGYGNGTGARVIAGVNWRWVNRYGHAFKAQGQLSQVSDSFAVQYTIPGRDPTRNQYALTASSFFLDPQDDTSRGSHVGIGYLTQNGHWKNSYQLVFLHENYRLEKFNTSRVSNALIPTVNFRRLKLDKPLNPTHGSDLTLMLRGTSSRAYISDFDFAQGDIKYTRLFSLTHDNRLLLRGDFGYTTVHEREDLPLSLNYYAGGPTSIRGYDSYAFGPGRYLVLATAELRQRIYGNLWASIFIDDGNAFDHFREPSIHNGFDYLRKKFNRGVGGGLIWHSPIGPVEVTVAKGDGYKVQFTVGML